MEKFIHDMIEKFLEVDRSRALREAELFGRLILKEFIACVKKRRGEGWQLRDLTMDDILVYYDYVIAEYRDGGYVALSVRTVNRFVEYSVSNNVLQGDPWEKLRVVVKNGEL